MAQLISRTDDQLSAEIAALESLSTVQLRQRWKALYGTEPPPRASRDLLMRAVAYRIQERALGGLSASTHRLLERIADDAAAGRVARVKPTRKPHTGAILLREWGGIQHQVTVLDERSAVSRQAIPLAVRGRTRDHRQPLVRSLVLWPEDAVQEAAGDGAR